MGRMAIGWLCRVWTEMGDLTLSACLWRLRGDRYQGRKRSRRDVQTGSDISKSSAA